MFCRIRAKTRESSRKRSIKTAIFLEISGILRIGIDKSEFVEVIYMAKHEFGIMMDAPQQGKRYDEYEPWKYACISVDDAYLEGVVERLTSIDFYWHTLSVKGKGLAYCGVTLVPPCSLKAFIDVVADNSELSELKKLLEKALSNNKWAIHYGL